MDFSWLVNGTLTDDYIGHGVAYEDDDNDDDEYEGGGEEEDGVVEDGVGVDDVAGDEDDFDHVQLRIEDEKEDEQVKDFLSKTCGCSLRDERPCSSDFNYTEMLNYRADVLQLTKEELDLVILTSIRMSMSDECINSKGNIRKNSRCLMIFRGKRICIPTFLTIHGISARKFYDIMKYYKISRSLSPRQHGNAGRLPKNTISFQDTVRIKQFLLNYASMHAILLPGRYPGFKDTRVRLLESHVTKKNMWELYVKSCNSIEFKAIGYTIFTILWKKLVPYIVISKPRTDLCDKCQQNNYLIFQTTNVEDAAKQEKLMIQEDHLYRSERERLFYKKQCKRAKDCLSSENVPSFVHLSFDFAQQLHYPAPPDQPGGLFFLTPRKCGLFGICNEARYQQVNYLIDEGVTIGKGPNCIISLLHHYLSKYTEGKVELHFHADNCVGQNKNNFVVQYFLWRILTERSSKITYSFMVVGHTKFACDACFGLLKKVTKRTFISSLDGIAACAHSSSTNIAELVGDEKGNLLVPWFDWKSFLTTRLRTLPNITKYHHFLFSSVSKVGQVHYKEYDDTTLNEINLLKNPANVFDKHSLPNKIYPEGLQDERKEYLFKEIRQYCKPGTEDLVAPDPKEIA